jgi:hypothetical protein
MMRTGKKPQRASANQKSEVAQLNGQPLPRCAEEKLTEETIAKRQSILTKTKMCTFYNLGKCKKGANCSFAHHDDELMQTPDLINTKMCKSVEEGIPCNNPNCRFAHSIEELRSLRKTGICAMKLEPNLAPRRAAPIQSTHAEHQQGQEWSTRKVSTEAVQEAERAMDDLSQIIANVLAPAVTQALRKPAEAPLAILQRALRTVDEMQAAGTPQEKEVMRQQVKADIGQAISFLQGSNAAQSDTGTSERFQAASTLNVTLGLPAYNAPGHRSLARGFKDLEASHDFSRQTSGAGEEFESVPAWSRQVSAWGYNPSKATEECEADSTDTGYSHDELGLPCHEEQSSEGRTSDGSDDGNSNGEDEAASFHRKSTGKDEDEALDVVQGPTLDSLPSFSFQRQDSAQSTASSIFEMSEAFGLCCTVKNTFFDVDPVDAVSPKARTRMTRSASPTLGTRDVAWDDPLELDGQPESDGFKRQTTD